MQLPDDVLVIIREFSKPMTRPDWRNCGRLSSHLLYNCLNYDLRIQNDSWNLARNNLVLYKRIFNYLIDTHWGKVYMMTRLFGIQNSSIQFETTIPELYKMPGILHAQEYHVRITNFYNTVIL
jgi:hypothetical protein